MEQEKQIVKISITFSLLLVIFVGFINPAYGLETKERVRSIYDGLSLSAGLEYEEGDYGTGDTTETWTIPVNVRYRTGNMSYEVTVPYLSAESTGDIVVMTGGGRHSTSTSRTTGQSESGIGDISLAVTYFLPQGADKELYLYLTGWVSLDTGDEQNGLGSGEKSYAIEASIDKYIGDELYFGTVGYQFFNDAVDVDYDNSLYGLVGLMRPWNNQTSLGGSLYYSQAATPGFDNIVELSGLFRHKLDRQRTLYGYILLGMSDGAADWGTGVRIRHYF